MSVETIFNFSNTPHSTVNVRVASKDDECSVGTAVVYKSSVVGKGFIVGERTGIGGGFFWTMKVRKCIIVSQGSSWVNCKRTYLVHYLRILGNVKLWKIEMSLQSRKSV